MNEHGLPCASDGPPKDERLRRAIDEAARNVEAVSCCNASRAKLVWPLAPRVALVAPLVRKTGCVLA